MSVPSSDRAAIRTILRTLAEDGWTFDHCDNGDELFYYTPKATTTDVLRDVTDVDMARIGFAKGEARGWVYFVLGNEPYEVASDYTISLSVLDTLIDGWINAAEG